MKQPIPVAEIRGLRESGWKPSDSDGTVSGSDEDQRAQLLQVIAVLWAPALAPSLPCNLLAPPIRPGETWAHTP